MGATAATPTAPAVTPEPAPTTAAAGDDHAAAALAERNAIHADRDRMKAEIARLDADIAAHEAAPVALEQRIDFARGAIREKIEHANTKGWRDADDTKGLLKLQSEVLTREDDLAIIRDALDGKVANPEAIALKKERDEKKKDLEDFEAEYSLVLFGKPYVPEVGDEEGEEEEAETAGSPSQILDSLTPNLEPAVSSAAAERAKADQARYDGPPCSQDLRGALIEAGFRWLGAKAVTTKRDEAEITVLLDDFAHTWTTQPDTPAAVEAEGALRSAGWERPPVLSEKVLAALGKRAAGMTSEGRKKLEAFTSPGASTVSPETYDRLKKLGFTYGAAVPLPEDVEEIVPGQGVADLLDDWETFRDAGPGSAEDRIDREHCLASLGWKAPAEKPAPKADEPAKKNGGKAKKGGKAAARPDGAGEKVGG